jgi:ABC-type branched-subunit amino acid transport system substrate-binding protein
VSAPQYLQCLWHLVGHHQDSIDRIFHGNYEAFSGGIKPDAPAADRSYDAGAIVALAVAKAGKGDAAAIKAAIRKSWPIRPASRSMPARKSSPRR